MKEYLCDFISIESTPRSPTFKAQVVIRMVDDDKGVACLCTFHSGAELAIIIKELIQAGDNVFSGDRSILTLRKDLAEPLQLDANEQKLLQGETPGVEGS
jgi:hypothetical protein